MVQCEMCGTETASPTTAKIEGAELQVCDSCAGFGTEVTSSDTSNTTTKYSTGENTGGGQSRGSSGPSSGGKSSSSGRSSGRDPFAELETLADDYPDRIRQARESRGLSQEELAGDLNEKASLIRKLERGDMQPNDAIQRKLERKLDISLAAGDGEADADWESDISPGETTLGDLVRRGE